MVRHSDQSTAQMVTEHIRLITECCICPTRLTENNTDVVLKSGRISASVRVGPAPKCPMVKTYCQIKSAGNIDSGIESLVVQQWPCHVPVIQQHVVSKRSEQPQMPLCKRDGHRLHHYPVAGKITCISRKGHISVGNTCTIELVLLHPASTILHSHIETYFLPG